MKKTVSAELPRGGFVGFVSKPRHLLCLVDSAARQTTVDWTVCEEALVGDPVIFYAMKPLYVFFAHGKVLRRLERKWGRKRIPMAEVGFLRLLPEPVGLQRAKERLPMPWLKTPSGFGGRRQTDVHLLLALGGA